MVLELRDLDLLSPPTSSAHILRRDISNFEAKSQSQIFGLNSPSLSLELSRTGFMKQKAFVRKYDIWNIRFPPSLSTPACY